MTIGGGELAAVGMTWVSGRLTAVGMTRSKSRPAAIGMSNRWAFVVFSTAVYQSCGSASAAASGLLVGDLAIEDGRLPGNVGESGGIGGVRIGREDNGVGKAAGRQHPELVAQPERLRTAEGVGVDRLGD